jgi:hypothetical protein
MPEAAITINGQPLGRTSPRVADATHSLHVARRRLMVARYELGFVRRHGYPRQVVAYLEKDFCEALDQMWRAQSRANAVRR